ncbi:leucine-rich repeat-containing protein 74B-like [Haliotis rufescens]|uniref:leucine-rich repeat-containing protein 74B-like n=1 Tax=Haliotis rufescens TaxID=6454 RepID=UPI00201F5788|nr:leucine-rich repeat-containing protein 74B-like [Haliotis rufescens]XP_046354105.2 leucine-rich repeat-containing protein 74B-like [Haliotis rufescens]
MPRVANVLPSQPVLRSEKARDLEKWVESSAATVANDDVEMPDTKLHGALTKPVLEIVKPEVTVSPEYEDDYSDVFKKEAVTTVKESKTLKVYRKACKRLGLVQLRNVISQFGSMDLCFRDCAFSAKELKALCMALLYERHMWHLDLSGNSVGRKEFEYVLAVLEKRTNVCVLDLSNNELSGNGVRQLADFLRRCDNVTDIDISGNKLTDIDGKAIGDVIQENNSLSRLRLAHNELRDTGGKIIGAALVKNRHLEELDMSWNHLRQKGAISIAKGLETNTCIQIVNLSWNGFGYEGSVALGDMLTKNNTITSLDISSNRISAAALLEIIRGLSKNRTLATLKIGHNPITASFTSVLLEAILKHPHGAIQQLHMDGVVVDKEFEGVLEKIRKSRYLEVTYEISLPITKKTREEMMKELQKPQAYNIDPLHMLYLLKEKNRARDFFEKINKDKDDGLTRDELFLLFKEAGLPCTVSVVDKIMRFMDTNGDGTIDLAEFLVGDKKIKKYSREQLRNSLSKQGDSYAKYSRTFRKAKIDPLTLQVKVEDASKQLSPNTLLPPPTGVPGSRRGSTASMRGN